MTNISTVHLRKALLWLGVIATWFWMALPGALAQTASSAWAPPQPINEQCCAAYPAPVADPWGQLHLFWVDAEGYIWYARATDDGWTPPVEVLANPAGGPAAGLDAVIDSSGIVHLIWRAGSTGGPVYYSSADVRQAGSSHAWSTPVQLADKALGAAIAIDMADTVYVAYTPFEAAASFSLIVSQDGSTWTAPAPASSSLTSEFTGGSYISLAVDQNGVLHAAWNSQAYPAGYPEHAVYYQHSDDGGVTWSEPYDPDPLPPEVDANTDSNFKNKMLKVAVGPAGDVNLTWHQYTGYRFHRRSIDGGNTWSDRVSVFPDMGAAFNGPVDMAFDSSGRMHVVATRGAVWYRTLSADGQWTPPQLVDPTVADWHHQRVAVVGGNQVYLFYPDINETGILWTTHRTVDAPALAPLPTPAANEPQATSDPQPADDSPTPLPVQTPSTPAAPLPEALRTAPSQSSAGSLWLWVLTPVLLVVGGAVVGHLLRTRRGHR